MFFKHEATILIKDYGWSFTYSDTILPSRLDYLYQEINKRKLAVWLNNQTEMYFPSWVKSHIEAMRIRNKLDCLFQSDQTARSFVPMKAELDSNSYALQHMKYDTLLKLIDVSHLKQIGLTPY